MKKKNLLNSLTRLTLALVFMVSLSLSSFAQTSGGFNYQAAIDPSYTTVTVEWTIGTYTGTVSGVTVTNGIISTVIGNGVNYSALTNPALTVVVKDDGGNVIATSTQVIKAVPYADVAKNVSVNTDGNIVINGTVFTGYSMDPTFNSVRVNSYLNVQGTGDAVNNDVYATTNASLRLAGGLFVGGVSYFDEKVYINQLMDVGSFSINQGQEVDGIYNVYPCPMANHKFYLPTYAALDMFLDSIGTNLHLDNYLLKTEAASIYETIVDHDADMLLLSGKIDNHEIRIATLEANDSLGLQHAYDMGNTVNMVNDGIILNDAGITAGGAGLISTYESGKVGAAVIGLTGNCMGALGANNYTTSGGVFGGYTSSTDTIFGVLGTPTWAGYFHGNVNIYGDLFANNATFGGLNVTGNETIGGDLSVTGTITAGAINATNWSVTNLTVTNTLTANTGIFQNLSANNADLSVIESENIESNIGHFNQLTVGQYHGSGLALDGTPYKFTFYKPVEFKDSVIFDAPVFYSGLSVGTLNVNTLLNSKKIVADTIIGNKYIYGKHIKGERIVGDTVAGKFVAGHSILSYNDSTVNLYAENANINGKLNLQDTMFTNSQFSVVNVDFTNAAVTPNLGYTSILGGSSAAGTAAGFDRADAAVLGYPKSFSTDHTGLGVLGTRLFNITNPLLVEAYGLTSGDSKVFAGFFAGDVAISGKLAVNTISAKAVSSVASFKTVDIDYTSVATEAFTSILGGSTPGTSLFASADAAVTGYDKIFTSDPAQGGLGVLGAKVYSITDANVLTAFDLTSGDNKVFAGFFVGDVYVKGKVAADQAIFLSKTTETTYKTVDVDYTAASNEGFTSILGGSHPTFATTEFTQADAAVIGYDKIFSTDTIGLGVLGTRIYNVNATAPNNFIYQAFGPAGWNSLLNSNKDKVFAGFFIGDVAILGNLAIKGNVKIDGSLQTKKGVIYGEIIYATDYADLMSQAVPCSADYPAGSAIIVMMGGTLKMYVALNVGGMDRWMSLHNESK